MIRIPTFAVFLFAAFCTESAYACWVPPIRTLDNQAVSGAMLARSGQPCRIVLQRSGGPMYSAEIVQPPLHGSASVQPVMKVVYQSRPGYVGPDTFVYARRGRDTRNNPVARTVRIAVRVIPAVKTGSRR